MYECFNKVWVPHRDHFLDFIFKLQPLRKKNISVVFKNIVLTMCFWQRNKSYIRVTYIHLPPHPRTPSPFLSPSCCADFFASNF